MRLSLLAPIRLEPATRRLALAATLLLPLALLHARAGAEILIGCVDGLFLIRCRAAPDTVWLRRPFTILAAAWWLWQLLCSILGTGGIVLALVAFRLPLFAVALGRWVLEGAKARRALWWALVASAAWIALESWQQYLTGHNLFGQPRWADGALTGPFHKPRAGPALILILFPVLVPAVTALAASPKFRGRVAALAMAAFGAISQILIGQRMPSLLLVVGFGLTALALPRLRLLVLAAAGAGALALAATPVLSPQTYDKLIVRTDEQLQNFVYSPYGEIWVRATVLAERHPIRGLGFDGFRRGCANPAAIRGVPWLGVTDAQARLATDACNIHPHNYYLEAADNGGLPLMALFTAMAACAVACLARGLATRPDARRAGLLVGAILAFWPFASTSAFTSMPNAGWIFLVLGFGFAESDRSGAAAGA